MCVGLPARVVTVRDGMALVDASGAKREVSAELIDQLDPGDYVMVHAGVAIAKITADEDEETDALLEDLQIRVRPAEKQPARSSKATADLR